MDPRSEQTLFLFLHACARVPPPPTFRFPFSSKSKITNYLFPPWLINWLTPSFRSHPLIMILFFPEVRLRYFKLINHLCIITHDIKWLLLVKCIDNLFIYYLDNRFNLNALISLSFLFLFQFLQTFFFNFGECYLDFKNNNYFTIILL